MKDYKMTDSRLMDVSFGSDDSDFKEPEIVTKQSIVRARGLQLTGIAEQEESNEI